MKIVPTSILLLLASIAALGQQDSSHRYLKYYPAADKGQARYVWHPPELPIESEARVEIIVGRQVEVDGVNSHSFEGTVKTLKTQQMGFDYYVATSNGSMIQTLIGVRPGSPKIMKFVKISGYQLYRYNSKLPIVVYVPEGFQVRFRVWRPADEVVDGQPG